MLPSQLAPFELVYIDQLGNDQTVQRNELRLTFETFELVVEHVRTSPDFQLEGYNLIGLGLEMVERRDDEVCGVMSYFGKQPELDGRRSFNFRMFKIRGPLPTGLQRPSFIDFAG